jgi:ketosteroid isomerase-like protein
MPPDRLVSTGQYGAPGDVEREIATVRAIYDAFGRRDVEGALAYCASEVEMVLPTTAGHAGRSGPYRGHAGVRAYFADVSAVWDDLTLHAHDIRATSRAVIVFGSITGRRGAERIRRKVVWTWMLRDGLAVSVRTDDLPGH